jgi:hypothetical protein
MKAIFEYRDGFRYTLVYPSQARDIYRKDPATKLIKRPYRVTFIGIPNNLSKTEEKWILDCKWALRKYDNTVLVDDMSESPVSQEKQESIVNLMNTKAKTDKVSTGMALIPWHSILAIGKIFVEGLRYSKDNWKKGVGDKDYQEERLEHALTHFALWKEGDRSEAHLAKVAWFCVTQLELERLEQLQNPSPLEVPPIAFMSAKALSEVHYDQYRDALSKHFGKKVHSFTNWSDRIEIKFQSGFEKNVVLYYNKDHDQVAALPNIKLFTK